MTPIGTTFAQSPAEGEALAHDMRVRWALEEVGQPYEVFLHAFRAMQEPTQLEPDPPEQISADEECELSLFESGATVIDIAARHPGLLPGDANARAHAIRWLFAALNTVEPPIIELETASLLERDKPWYLQRLPFLEGRIRTRLGVLSRQLGEADWLDGDFSAADLMMVMVLSRLDGSGILERYPNLAAYVARGRARPAYRRAFDAQLAASTALKS
jgi:glutathione S-transferase